MSEQPWIEWPGGDCPVVPGTKVETQARDGHTSTQVVEADATSTLWHHEPGVFPQWDIVRYRVVQP